MMSEVLFVLTILTTNCEPHPKTHSHKTFPSRNQKIIKVQGPPHYNHFHGHHKPVRNRPFVVRGEKEEFIRPNHPPPIPPFFKSPSTNHIKHLPRPPPPHVFHKSPSYGLGFPYKTLTSFRPAPTKDVFRVQTIPVIRPASVPSTGIVSTSSSSTTYHSPTFAAPSYIPPAVGHIISSDDNNGPIREIPAPNLGPKPHEGAYSSASHIDASAFLNFGKDSSLDSNAVVKDSGSSFFGSYGKGPSVDINAVVKGSGNSFLSSYGKGQSVDVNTIIKDTGNPFLNSYAKEQSLDINAVIKDPGNAYLGSFGKEPGVNVDAIVKDPGLTSNTFLKESGGDLSYGKQPTVEIANFDEGSSIDVTNLIKDAGTTAEHSSGYEVTEHHHNHLPTNDQIIKGHDGTKLYYAPDPDPSLPVHKVPPTSDPHSTPSNGQTINNVYVPQIPQGFPYLPGTVGAPVATLSSQELFHLMHGYPTVPAVLPQPVVTFVGQPQSTGVILPGGAEGGHNYYQQGIGGAGGQYSQQDHYNGNEINQYLQQPEIHNLLHNSAQSHQELQTLGASHSSVVNHDNYPTQSQYSPQNQYQNFQSQYQTAYKEADSNSDSSNEGRFPTSEINHNYQYEPEASETRNSLTVIRQTNEGSLSSATVKELLLESSAENDLKYKGNDYEKGGTSESIPTILQLKNIPEVPFYASLPNKKAAEALAGLQAAGSIASNYMNRIKIARGDQGPERDEGEQSQERRKADDNLGVSHLQQVENIDSKDQGRLLKEEMVHFGSEKTEVDIQPSVSLYEAKIASKHLAEPSSDYDQSSENNSDFSSEGQLEQDLVNIDFKEDVSNETFGKRIRPK